jgi:hypothetical protein
MTDQEHGGEQPLEYEDPKPAALSPEEMALAEEQERKEEQEIRELTRLPDPEVGGAPAWVVLPAGLRVPRGRQVYFVRFPAEWTSTPKRGIRCRDQAPDDPSLWRQAICWDMSIGDQKLALQRAAGDPNRQIDEFSKQMVRAVDGELVDWSGMPGAGCVDLWWEDLGARCRNAMHRIFNRLHVLSKEEMARFFESCIAVRSMG